MCASNILTPKAECYIYDSVWCLLFMRAWQDIWNPESVIGNTSDPSWVCTLGKFVSSVCIQVMVSGKSLNSAPDSTSHCTDLDIRSFSRQGLITIDLELCWKMVSGATSVVILGSLFTFAKRGSRVFRVGALFHSSWLLSHPRQQTGGSCRTSSRVSGGGSSELTQHPVLFFLLVGLYFP